MDCILEDTVSSSAPSATAATSRGARRGSRIPSGSRGSSRRGSSTDIQDPSVGVASTFVNSDCNNSGIAEKANLFSYWLQVSVSPQVNLILKITIEFS